MGTANWMLALMADWYEEIDLPKMMSTLKPPPTKSFANGQKPNPCWPLSKCCCVVMCMTAATGGNLQPLYERIRGIPENALQNLVAILSIMVLALPMSVLQMSVALGDVHRNVTYVTSKHGDGDGERPEAEGFGSVAIAMWAFAFATAMWEKDQLRWWNAMDVGALSPYFVWLCVFRLFECIARVTLLALFAATFGGAATAVVLVGGITLVHMAKYLTSHYKRLTGRDAPLQSVEQWVQHATIQSRFWRDNEPDKVSLYERRWSEVLSLNGFSRDTTKLINTLPLCVKSHIHHHYATRQTGSVKMGWQASVAQTRPDVSKSEELLDYEQSRPRVPHDEKEEIELACTAAMMELHLRNATPLQAHAYLLSAFPSASNSDVWFENPANVTLVPGCGGILGLILWYFLYLGARMT
jgi:hypothetical protein